jgi:predicted dehydrogenase
MYYTRDQKSWVKPNMDRTSKTALDELIDVVQGHGELTITIDDAVKAQEIIEAVYKSSAEGRVVKLPLV